MRGWRTFLPIASTAPAFNSSAFSSTAARYALESTVRSWSGPSNRTVRMVSDGSSVSYFAQFGTSTAEASTATSFMALGRQQYLVHVGANISHVSLVSSGTVIVNLGLGYGGEETGDYRAGPGIVTTSTISTDEFFTIQEAASIIHVDWLTATWTIGNAFHILGGYNYSTAF